MMILSAARIRARMLWLFVLRDLREQYAGTLLGGVWALLQPMLQVAVYWWVFGFIWALKIPAMGSRDTELPFAVFLLSALLPWLAFQDAINKATVGVLARVDVLRHGPFPVVVFPLARVVSAHLVFAGLLAAFAAIVAGPAMAAAPVLPVALFAWYGLQLLFACGLGLLFAALAVYVRDLQHLVSMLLLAIFFTAPILYPLAQIPEFMQSWIWVNPFTPFAIGYHALLLEEALPGPGVWFQVLALAFGTLFAGLVLFRRLRPGFADVV